MSASSRDRSGLAPSAHGLRGFLRGAVCLFALVSAACSGTRVAAEALPFHLAVVPFDVIEQPAGKGMLGFDGGELARELGGTLDGLTFTEVTVLGLPPGVPAAEFAAWPREERERHWIESASASGADVLLLSRMELDPHVETQVPTGRLVRGSFEALFKLGMYTEFNPYSVGFNLFLSLWGWSRDELEHRVRVGYDAALLDLGPLLDPTSEADLVNQRTQLVHAWKFESEVSSTFNDRQGWLGHVLSLLVPGAFLPSDRAVLAVSLRENIAASVFEGLVEELEFRKLELLHGDGPFPFRVEHLALVREPRGTRVLHADVALTTETIDAMDGYRVWVDGELVRDEGFDAPVARESGLARYSLRIPLGLLPPSAVVRLELRDAAPRQNVRTFTLRADRTGRRSEKKLALHLPSGASPLPH